MTDLGQIYTNSKVASYMVSLFDLQKKATIMDPCYGTGAFLDALLDYGYKNVTACEIDSDLYEKTKTKYHRYNLINGDFLKYTTSDKFDGIIMNPPYIRQEKINQLESFGITKKWLRSDSIFYGLPSTANMYMYFIIKAINLLKSDGQLIVIFPSSWVNTKNGIEFQKNMLSECCIERKVHIHGDVFTQEALVDVIILKLVKRKTNSTVIEEYLESKNNELERFLPEEKREFVDFSYPFSKLATVRRGLTTGCNEMYVNPNFTFKNDSCFKPIISSPKSIEGYSTINACLDRLFFPTRDNVTVEVSQYLDYWKNKIVQEQRPKTLYSKIKCIDEWYELYEVCSDGIWFSYFVRNDMKFIMNETNVLARDNFYIINPKIDKWIMFTLLNNYYTYFQLELRGKKYGAGLLKIQRYDIEGLCFPDYETITDDDKKKMIMLGKKLLKEANCFVIEEITQFISKYSNISFKEIKEEYLAIKANRLGNK